MKAISLWQPWASAMALGLKPDETRHWTTSYRGLLAIHAAKRWTADERDFTEIMGLPSDLPLGAVVAVGTLVAIRPAGIRRLELSEAQQEWGNYADGRFAWLFRDVVGLREPIPCKGAQGFFELATDVGEAVLQQASSIDPSPVQFGLALQ